jgi:hypothetical protein
VVGERDRLRGPREVEARRVEQAPADRGVQLDLLELLVGEPAALEQERVGDADLAEVVQRGGAADEVALAGGQVELGGDEPGQPADPAGVLTRVVVAQLGGLRQAVEDLELGALDLCGALVHPALELVAVLQRADLVACVAEEQTPEAPLVAAQLEAVRAHPAPRAERDEPLGRAGGDVLLGLVARPTGDGGGGPVPPDDRAVLVEDGERVAHLVDDLLGHRRDAHELAPGRQRAAARPLADRAGEEDPRGAEEPQVRGPPLQLPRARGREQDGGHAERHGRQGDGGTQAPASAAPPQDDGRPGCEPDAGRDRDVGAARQARVGVEQRLHADEHAGAAHQRRPDLLAAPPRRVRRSRDRDAEGGDHRGVERGPHEDRLAVRPERRRDREGEERHDRRLGGAHGVQHRDGERQLADCGQCDRAILAPWSASGPQVQEHAGLRG